MLLTYGITSAQKKKKVVQAKEPATVILAKTEDLVAEIIKGNFYTFRLDGKAKKDTLLLKNLTGTPTPTECTIKKFMAKDTPLYLISWKENASLETNTKKEEVTITCSQIWNPKLKSKVFDNEQKSVKIKEQVFLDQNRTASETQHRMRNEGYILTLLPTGDFTLKNKSAETKYVLNPIAMQYEVPAKAIIPSAAKPPVKKKR